MQSQMMESWIMRSAVSSPTRWIAQTLATIRPLHDLRRDLYGEGVMREEEEVVVETGSDVTPAAYDDRRGVSAPALLHQQADAAPGW